VLISTSKQQLSVQFKALCVLNPSTMNIKAESIKFRITISFRFNAPEF